MVDHVGYGVSDYQRSKPFFEQALAPLGITLLMEVKEAAAASARTASRSSGSRCTGRL